jgi:hypothetical protein
VQSEHRKIPVSEERLLKLQHSTDLGCNCDLCVWVGEEVESEEVYHPL